MYSVKKIDLQTTKRPEDFNLNEDGSDLELDDDRL